MKVDGQPGALVVGSMVENRAQSFARHLLIPLLGVQHFFQRLQEPYDLKAFSDLVQRFQVSPAMAGIQLRELDLLGAADVSEWSAMFTPALAARFGWGDQYAALQAESRQRRAPQRLLARVIEGYVAGLVSLETVASVRGVTTEALTNELATAGIVPARRQDFSEPDDPAALPNANE